MKQPLVTIFTIAYNAENYVGDTIQSVLNQSEKNIEYIIRDNGSTDNTGQIIRWYAEQDSRIIILNNKVNHRNDDGSALKIYEYFQNPKGKYLSFLDSDDLLNKDYVKEMYAAGEKFDSDFVIGGTNMFQDGTNNLIFSRIPPYLEIKKGCKLEAENFQQLYGSLRPLWGKLYKTELFIKYIYEFHSLAQNFKNGVDTAISLTYSKNVSRIVSIDKALHNYRVRESSDYSSATIDFGRIKDGELLFELGLDTAAHFKIDRSEILNFLLAVHNSHIEDLLNLCFRSNIMSTKDKLNFFERVIRDKTFNIYAQNSGRYPVIMDMVKKIILNNGVNAQNLYDSFLVRLGISNSDYIKMNNSVRLILLLSAVLDDNNSFMWGKHLIPIESENIPKWFKYITQNNIDKQKGFLKNRDVLRETLGMNKEIENLAELKISILDAIDFGNLKAATENLDLILYYQPIDRDALYLKMYVSYLCKDFCSMNIMASLGEMFWDDDEEIMNFVKNIKIMNEKV